MVDLTTTYMGMKLGNPLVASSSPFCKDIAKLVEMEDAGISAVVLHSLFEEQITLESMDLDNNLWQGTESFAESLSYFPEMTSYNIGPEGYLEHIRKAKKALDIPVIASLNGYSSGGWMRYAKLMEEAGADGLELNMYFLSADPKMPSAEVEAMYQRLVANIRSSISIPLAVKLSPFFSALANFAMSLDEAGADALVLFNRFYQPDIDLETLSIEPSLQLSEPEELRLRLRWVGLLAGRVKADLAVTGGVHASRDVIKSMMAGARVAMTTSALLHHGIAYAADILVGLKKWMGEHEYSSIQQMQGSFSQARVKDPTTFERANYMKVLRTYAANGVPRQLAEGELPII